jgi:alkylation response protein AidB-like acyl-CoA dehydrogenase
MQLDLAPQSDPRRREVRDWLQTHRDPTPDQLAGAGWVAPRWPRPWGRDADQITALIYHQELERAKIALPENPIGVGWAGPTLIAGGTEEQQARYLPGLLSGREYWCQLFSEPGAGSDLASLRTRAVRDGDEYVIDGQKVWSTWAERSEFGILLARTDFSCPKHKGISYFVMPMDTPGVTVRPIREMTGEAHFNEVFFDDVRLPVQNRVGAENEGWALARVTLANERVNVSRGGLCWGLGPTADDFFDLIRAQGGISDPVLRQRAAAIYAEKEVLAVLDQRILSSIASGQEVGPEASIKKAFADEHAQRLLELAKDLTGAAGMLEDHGPLGAAVDRWHWAFLFSRALTIGGGTAQVQRTMLGERVLGLPPEPHPR